MQFMAFSREIPYETTATKKVTVRPSIHTTAGTILIIVSLINSFARDNSENQTCVAEVSSLSELNTLTTELSWLFGIPNHMGISNLQISNKAVREGYFYHEINM